MSTQTTTTEAASGAEGFVLVPREPTEKMYAAAYPWFGSSRFNFSDMYHAMVAAAPVMGTEGYSSFDGAFHGKPRSLTSEEQRLVMQSLSGAPQPAGAERVDLGELERLSAAASQGEWSVERIENHGTSSADKFFSYGIECGPHTILDTLNSSGGVLEQEHDEDWTTVWDEQARRNLTYIAALVNAHRAGHLVPASLPAALGSGEGTAGADVLAERRRQIEAGGWTPEHDDTHPSGDLAQAAASYAMHAGYVHRERVKADFPPANWPWSRDWWKPTTRRGDLVKAGALILAEIERLDRATLTASQEQDGGVRS